VKKLNIFYLEGVRLHSKMRLHIYHYSEDCGDEGDVLTSVGSVEATGDDRDSRVRAVVGWLLDKVVKRSTHIPYFIEVSIQEHFKKEMVIPLPEMFVDELDIVEFKRAIDRILESEYLMKTFYTRWTEEEPEPLVIVAESDVAAEFILRRFPPVEYYAHVKEDWDEKEGESEEDCE
jgi:hypothetical protein